MSEETKRSIMETMFRISRLVRQEQGIGAGGHNLTFQQLQALLVVWRHKQIKMSALAEELAVSPASATQLVDKLVEDAWLQRSPDEQDRRIVYLSTTKEGAQRLESLRKRRAEGMNKILGTLSEHDLSELERILKTLLDSLSQS